MDTEGPSTKEKDGTVVVSPKAFVRTYNHPSYADPWEAIEDYRRVMKYSSKHPNLGGSAISSRFDLPRGRIRPWIDGSKPDPLRGLEAAEARGWINVSADSDIFRGLNVFCSWVFSGGSIQTDTSVPYFAIRDDRDTEILRQAAALANIELDYSRAVESGRSSEMRPSADASVSGRVLQVMGAPPGGKNIDSSIQLPHYLKSVGELIRREFVQVYLHNRGQHHEQNAMMTLREERSDGYLQALAQFVQTVTGEQVTTSGKNVIISADSAREMANWESLLASNQASDY